MTRLIAAFLLLICIAPSAATAQTSATLVGTVQDAQSGRLPGVTVRIRDVATGAAREIVTDAEGRFRAAALSAGEYELRASLAGFRPLLSAPAADRRRERGGHADAAGRHRRGGHRAGHVRPEHADRRPQLPDRSADHRADSGQRAQLHRPHAADSGRHGVPQPRQRIGGGTRPGDERQRAEPAHQHLPARRHAAERLHQQPGQQRRRHRARHGDDSRVPRRLEQLQRRVRAQRRRPDQRAHQVRQQPARRHRLLVPPQRRDGRPQLLRRRREAELLAAPDRRHARRPAAHRSPVLLRRLRRPVREPRAHRRHHRARRQRPARRAADRHGRHQPDDAALPARVPDRQRAVARRRPRPAPLRLRPAADAALRRRAASTPCRRRVAVLRPLHARRRRAGAADRLPAVPARLRLAQPVPHRRVPPRAVAVDVRHRPLRLQPHRDRPDRRVEHDAGRVAVRARTPDDGRHRHRRPAALRPAALRRSRARAGRLQRPGRRDARPRQPSAQGRRSRRALLGDGVQPDLQPRRLSLRQPADLPRRHGRVVHRPDAGRRRQPRLGLDAGRRLRAGRLERDARPHGERRTPRRGRDRAGRSARHQHAGPAGRAGRRRALPESGRDVLAADRRGVERRRRRSHDAARRLRPLLHAQQPAGSDRHGDQPAGDAAGGHRQPDVPGAAVRARRRHLGAADPGRHRLSARPRVERQPAADAVGRLGGVGRGRRRARRPPVAQHRHQRAGADDPGRRHAVLPGRPGRGPTRATRPSS